MAASIDHQTLGTKIQGKSSNGVTQYLGIKYGHLKNRFAEATMAEPTGDMDATKLGSVAVASTTEGFYQTNRRFAGLPSSPHPTPSTWNKD